MIEHGIQNDKSDYNVRIGVLARQIFVFPTLEGIKAMEKAKEIGVKQKSAYQPGVSFATANGYPTPIDYVEELIIISIPDDIYLEHLISQRDSTSIKGEKAQSIVISMLKRGLIPLPLQVNIVDDKDLQIISQTDIIIHSKLHLQIKCDYRCGNKNRHPQCTGNFYFQTEESNPLRKY